MTAVATSTSAAPSLPNVDDASPELTKKIGVQFDNAMTKAIRLLEQYEGSLARKDEAIGGETTRQLANLKQGLAIARAAAEKLAGRGEHQARVAEIVRNVPDVQPAASSYYGSKAR